MPRQATQTVFDRRRGSYTRTIAATSVTHTCRRCGREETYEQLPGRTRKYCRICLPAVEAEQNAARQRRWRERRRQTAA